VLAQCRARHRHQEFLAFLKRIESAVPSDLDVHLVVDNYATHKHPKVRAWLAARPRFHTHYTPTYASWLNQVERWFAILTSREIRRGSYRQRQGPDHVDHDLRRRLQRPLAPLRLDCHRRRHPRQARPTL
jgi:transposase